MMNKYRELRNRQQQEMNAFPLGAAFTDQQFEEMMQKWGLTVNDKRKILSIGGGCYLRKTDEEAFDNMLLRFRQELQDAIMKDKKGDGFIEDMFYEELANHEFGFTGDLEPALEALHLTVDEINENKQLLNGLNRAIKQFQS